VKLALDVKDPRTKVEALAAAAKRLVHRQDAAGALSAARAALAASSKVKVAWRTEALGRAAAALIRAGDTKTWTRKLESALEELKATTPPTQRATDARTEGRDAVFAVLEPGAACLAKLHDGRELAGVVREIVEVEGWWQVMAG
jgi:hypothetical protein